MQERGVILAIDDESDILENLDIRLSSSGYKVLKATDGTQGIAIAREDHPDLIILDIMMPGIDGFETLKILKGDGLTKSIPVVVVSSGNPDVEWAARSMELGSSGYIVKPFDGKDLLRVIERIVRS